MTLCELTPVMRRLFYFAYQHTGEKNKKISYEKTQYTYRFLYVNEGFFDVYVSGKTQRLAAGDLLFLTPKERYRLLPASSDFSLYNLFFDFVKANGVF